MATTTQKKSAVFSHDASLKTTDVVRVKWNEDKTVLMCPKGAFDDARFISVEASREIFAIVAQLEAEGIVGIKEISHANRDATTHLIGQVELLDAVMYEAGFSPLELLAFLVFNYGVRMTMISRALKDQVGRPRLLAVAAVVYNRYEAAEAQNRGCEIITL